MIALLQDFILWEFGFFRFFGFLDFGCFTSGCIEGGGANVISQKSDYLSTIVGNCRVEDGEKGAKEDEAGDFFDLG